MKQTMIALATAATLVVASVASAAPIFKDADTNGDGSLDAAEFAATKLDRKFEKLDKNGDGVLNKEEYRAALDEDCE